MRWWMITYPPRAAAIENANVIGMDYTILPSNTSMVQWTDGRGEIEYNDRPRLREVFYDMTPYVPLLQQFMTRLTGITLKQAKNVQGDLITELYDNHRQQPFHQVVTAGDFNWEATDAAVAAMAATGLPALFNATAGSTNSLVANINTMLIADINSLSALTNSNFNSSVIPNVNNDLSALVAAINSGISTPAASLITYINNTMLGDNGTLANTLNFKLQTATVGGVAAAAPGLAGNIVHTGIGFSGVSTTAIPNAATLGVIPDLPGVGTIPNINWLPLGGTAMVSLTLTELMTIMQGIADRRTTLTITQNTKLNEVAALTSVADVIAYDPTTGW